MKIAVCIKRVPDTTSQIKVGASGKSIDPAGIQWVLNPYDEYAVEEALKLKELAGAGEVVVISIGPAGTDAVLRTCLAMGADRAIWLKDESPERDSWGVASVLAETLKEVAPNLICFGKQAVDDDAHQVGPMVAELLGYPMASVVVKVTRDGDSITCEREIEGGHETLKLKLPAVISAQKGLNTPRFASLKGIMAAKKKPLEEKPARAVAPAMAIVRMEPPAARPAPRIVGKDVAAVAELVKLLREEAKVL